VLFNAKRARPLTDAPADKSTRWAQLEAKAKACTACVLAKTRQNVVFGAGDRGARLVFVGEGPGADEDAKGEPFVGKAGQLLNKIIAAMGLKREEVYICNVVKCRPPENRTPLPDEVMKCHPFLVEQIELVGPKAIVALGSPAAKTLLNTTQGIMSLRGRWHMYRGIPVMPTYHPAYVLRQYTEEVRRAVWEDMKKVVAKLQAAQSG
jgi:DNA polymerase